MLDQVENGVAVQAPVAPKSQKVAKTDTPTLDEQIAKAEERVKRLKEEKRELQRKEQERREREIWEAIKSAKLDEIASEAWRSSIGAISATLHAATERV
jgi:TolA-binding protein